MAESAAAPKLTFEVMKLKNYPDWGFRPGVPCIPFKMNFVFLNGGMGDYITWTRPIQWLADQATWIEGTLIIPVYFLELAKYWLRNYPGWKIKTYVEQGTIEPDQTPCRGPIELQRESLNATGAHLSTCGWVYFTNKERAPDGWEHYPQFEQSYLDQVELPAEMNGVNKYAVFAIGVTTPSRHVPGAFWNPIIEHVKALGLTPVFLGKSVTETGNVRNIHTMYDKAVRRDIGIDLVDKTTLTQAAAVMSRAAVVIGHDNGLLHLAGCTSAPIVFGYNLASPEHREPRRPAGKTYNVTLTKKELACIHCQSETNFLIGYNFRECFYKDNKCIDILFEDQGRRWKENIDLAIHEGTNDITK